MPRWSMADTVPALWGFQDAADTHMGTEVDGRQQKGKADSVCTHTPSRGPSLDSCGLVKSYVPFKAQFIHPVICRFINLVLSVAPQHLTIFIFFIYFCFGECSSSQLSQKEKLTFALPSPLCPFWEGPCQPSMFQWPIQPACPFEWSGDGQVAEYTQWKSGPRLAEVKANTRGWYCGIAGKAASYSACIPNGHQFESKLPSLLIQLHRPP